MRQRLLLLERMVAFSPEYEAMVAYVVAVPWIVFRRVDNNNNRRRQRPSSRCRQEIVDGQLETMRKQGEEMDRLREALSKGGGRGGGRSPADARKIKVGW